MIAYKMKATVNSNMLLSLNYIYYIVHNLWTPNQRRHDYIVYQYILTIVGFGYEDSLNKH